MPSSRWPYGPGTGAAAPGLDAEQVVEQCHDQVVMQVSAAVPDGEADDRQAPGVPVAQDVDAGHALPTLDGPPDERALAGRDGRLADLLLELEREAGPDGADDVGRAGLLAMLRVGQVDVLVGVDVRDRAAARPRWAPGSGTGRAGPPGRPACRVRR